MTLEVDRVRTKSPSLRNSLGKGLMICRKADYVMICYIYIYIYIYTKQLVIFLYNKYNKTVRSKTCRSLMLFKNITVKIMTIVCIFFCYNCRYWNIMRGMENCNKLSEKHIKGRVSCATGVASISRPNQNHRSIIHRNSCCGDYDFTFITAQFIMKIRSLFR